MDIEEDESGVPKRDPRLVIRSLELENFKSYAGVQRIGPLHKVLSLKCCFSGMDTFIPLESVQYLHIPSI